MENRGHLFQKDRKRSQKWKAREYQLQPKNSINAYFFIIFYSFFFIHYFFIKIDII